MWPRRGLFIFLDASQTHVFDSSGQQVFVCLKKELDDRGNSVNNCRPELYSSLPLPSSQFPTFLFTPPVAPLTEQRGRNKKPRLPLLFCCPWSNSPADRAGEADKPYFVVEGRTRGQREKIRRSLNNL